MIHRLYPFFMCGAIAHVTCCFLAHESTFHVCSQPQYRCKSGTFSFFIFCHYRKDHFMANGTYKINYVICEDEIVYKKYAEMASHSV